MGTSEKIGSAGAGDPTDWIEHAAREHARRVFLRTPAGAELSYAELREQSARFAAALMRRGVSNGDRVAVRVEKSAEAIVLYVACLRMGAVYVPINVAATAHELEHLLHDANPRLLVAQPSEADTLAALARSAGAAHVETLGAEGQGSLTKLARRCAPDAGISLMRDPRALAALVYTSGTTGRSKGAMLTRGNLASNARTLAEAWRFTSEDVLLHILPLFHVHGLFAAINTVLASASSLLLLPRFTAAEVLRHLPQVTTLMGVPTHYTRLLQDEGLNGAATAHMRLFVSGSAPLLAETHREFFRRTGHMILERYGMTETLFNTSNPYEGPRVPGSVGPPLPGVSIRLTDRESGALIREPDVIGTLELTGPNVFAGYFRDPEKTRAAFTADGWFKTGDLARIDRNGYVYIVGRAKDLVISGGYNVYPKEVESELDALPGVTESAVFGVAHSDLGEAVTAAVVLAPEAVLSEAEIISAVRTRLSGYKVPKRVILIAELPRNAMGKVQKDALRARYASLYQSS